jgi:hypothetical protein
MIFASALTTTFTAIGVLAAAATIITLLMTGWKVIRDGVAADTRRIAEAEAQAKQVAALQVQIEQISRLITPNGKDTDGIGDTVARIEDAVTAQGKTLTNQGKTLEEMGTSFQHHLVASEQEHMNMWKAINKKANSGTTS